MSTPALRKRPLASLIAAALFVALCSFAVAALEASDPDQLLAAGDAREVQE